MPSGYSLATYPPERGWTSTTIHGHHNRNSSNRSSRPDNRERSRSRHRRPNNGHYTRHRSPDPLNRREWGFSSGTPHGNHSRRGTRDHKASLLVQFFCGMGGSPSVNGGRNRSRSRDRRGSRNDDRDRSRDRRGAGRDIERSRGRHGGHGDGGRDGHGGSRRGDRMDDQPSTIPRDGSSRNADSRAPQPSVSRSGRTGVRYDDGNHEQYGRLPDRIERVQQAGARDRRPDANSQYRNTSPTRYSSGGYESTPSVGERGRHPNSISGNHNRPPPSRPSDENESPKIAEPKSVHWATPLSNIEQQPVPQRGHFSSGQEMRVNGAERVSFLDHNTETTTWDDRELPPSYQDVVMDRAASSEKVKVEDDSHISPELLVNLRAAGIPDEELLANLNAVTTADDASGNGSSHSAPEMELRPRARRMMW